VEKGSAEVLPNSAYSSVLLHISQEKLSANSWRYSFVQGCNHGEKHDADAMMVVPSQREEEKA